MATKRQATSRRAPVLGSATRHGLLGLILAMTAAIALAGCGTEENVSFTCGPEEEPRECGWLETRRAKAAFTEAEDRYMITRKYMNAVLQNPHGKHDWEGLADYSVDPYLADIKQLSEEYREEGRYLDQDIPVTQIDRLSYHGDTLHFAVCGDGSKVAAKNQENDELVNFGTITRLHIRALRVDGGWKIESAEHVDLGPCEASG